MSAESEDEGDSETWISVRSLKEAANIKTVYRFHTEEALSSLNCSATAESVPNLPINVSPSFSSLHEFYLPHPPKTPVHSRSSSQMLTRRAQEEALELQTDLLQTKRELELLREQLAACEQHHANQLQSIQAHHERKMQRYRQDLQELIRQIPQKQPKNHISALKTAHEAEIRQIKCKFMEKIEVLQVKMEEKLKKQEENFEEKLENVRKEAENRGKMLEKRYKSEISQLTRSEKSLEITNLPDVKINSDFPFSNRQKCTKIPDFEAILNAEKGDLSELEPAKGKSCLISYPKSVFDTEELEQVIAQIE